MESLGGRTIPAPEHSARESGWRQIVPDKTEESPDSPSGSVLPRENAKYPAKNRRVCHSGRNCLPVLLVVLVFDLIWCPLTDKVPRHGKGYGSHRRSEGVAPPVRFGLKRVIHNFRHFTVYWRPPRKAGRGAGVPAFLTADGNSVWTNLGGHFGLSVLLCLTFLSLGARWTWVLAGATLVNVWHEYVSEGLYCDPSYVDLWLDQAGILLALGLFAARRFFSARVPTGT